MLSYDRALHALRSWLDSWSGIGHVAVGMARQGSIFSSRDTTRRAGGRPSIRRGWSTPLPARRVRAAVVSVAAAASHELPKGGTARTGFVLTHGTDFLLDWRQFDNESQNLFTARLRNGSNAPEFLLRLRGQCSVNRPRVVSFFIKTQCHQVPVQSSRDRVRGRVDGVEAGSRQFGEVLMMNLIVVMITAVTGEVSLRLISTKNSGGGGAVILGNRLLPPREWQLVVRHFSRILQTAASKQTYLVYDDLLGWTIGANRRRGRGRDSWRSSYRVPAAPGCTGRGRRR